VWFTADPLYGWRHLRTNAHADAILLGQLLVSAAGLLQCEVRGWWSGCVLCRAIIMATPWQRLAMLLEQPSVALGHEAKGAYL